MNSPKSRVRYSLSTLVILTVGIALGLSFATATKRLRPRVVPSEADALDLREYVIEPPDVVAINADPILNGEFLVGPDGKVNLGAKGSVVISGCSISESESRIRSFLKSETQVSVRVATFNSKAFYMFHDANGTQEAYRLIYTGNNTVLDALSNYPDHDVAKKNIWISRPGNSPSETEVIAVDYQAITNNADTSKNYQLLPGDRLFVSSKAAPTQTP